MDYLEILGSPVIVLIIYSIFNLLKLSLKKSKYLESFKQFIPMLSALSGSILGIAAFYLAPEIIPAGNVFTAILAGGASGLAATGCHQIFKQIGKCNCDKNSKIDYNDKSNI